MRMKLSFRRRPRTAKPLSAFPSVIAIAMGCLVSTIAHGYQEFARINLYSNIAPDKLVSIYKKSYILAGFELKKQTTEVLAKENKSKATLTFEFVAEKEQHEFRYSISYSIYLPTRSGAACQPCRVVRELTVSTPVSMTRKISSSDIREIHRKKSAAEENALLLIEGVINQMEHKLGREIHDEPEPWRRSEYYHVYENIHFDDLVSSYRKAYEESGFKAGFDTAPGTIIDSIDRPLSVKTLDFLFLHSEDPRYKWRIAIELLIPQVPGPYRPDNPCAPCFVNLKGPWLESGNPGLADKTARNRFEDLARGAENNARDRIRARLGSYLRPEAAERQRQPAAE